MWNCKIKPTLPYPLAYSAALVDGPIYFLRAYPTDSKVKIVVIYFDFRKLSSSDW